MHRVCHLRSKRLAQEEQEAAKCAHVTSTPVKSQYWLKNTTCSCLGVSIAGVPTSLSGRCRSPFRGHREGEQSEIAMLGWYSFVPMFHQENSTFKICLPLFMFMSLMVSRLSSYQGLSLNARDRRSCRSSQNCRDSRNRLTSSHLTTEENQVATHRCSKNNATVVLLNYVKHMWLKSACNIINHHSSHTWTR